jgi:hypothetical protein
VLDLVVTGRYEALDTKNLPYCPKHDDTLSDRSREDPSYANFEGRDHPLVGTIPPVLTTDDLMEKLDDGSRKATVPA